MWWREETKIYVFSLDFNSDSAETTLREPRRLFPSFTQFLPWCLPSFNLREIFLANITIGLFTGHYSLFKSDSEHWVLWKVLNKLIVIEIIAAMEFIRIDRSQIPESGADLNPVQYCCNTFKTKQIHQLVLQLCLF